MDTELQQKLQQHFPVLYRDLGRPDTSMAWGITCPNSWFDLLWRLSVDLEKLNPNLVASQVKEKFGTLRFYLRQSDYGDKTLDPAKLIMDERIWNKIREAEAESTMIASYTSIFCPSYKNVSTKVIKMSEIQFVAELLKKITRNKSIQDHLCFFNERGSWRWENWLQMELIYQLGKMNIEDSYLESSHEYDQRHSLQKGNTRAHIDLIYRRPNFSKDIFTAVELKAKMKVLTCFKESIKDLSKISQIKSSEFVFRSVISISILNKSRKLNPKIRSIIDVLQGEIVNGGEYYDFAIIGWDGGNKRDSWSKEEYTKWIKKLQDICIEHHIDA